jgi:hypothetical protein
VSADDGSDLIGEGGVDLTAQTLVPGSTIADFRVESLLRSSPGATVYRAQQELLGRRVALVVTSAPEDSEPAARFADAARRLAAVEHPHVLPVYEVGRSGAVTFAAMREPQGRSLTELVADGPLSRARSAAIAERVAEALAALEAAGVGPIELSADDVFVTDADDVQVAALEAALNGAPAADTAGNVTRLLAAMGDAPPEPPAGRRAWLVAGALAALAIAGAVALVVASGGGDDQGKPAAAPQAPASAPAARLVATIPLDGTPGSTAIGSGSLWVATTEGNVLRIDPRTDRVVGAPIRFAPRDRHNNVTVRAGADAVYALDGNRGRIARIDPRSGTVTARRTLGGMVSGATVDDGVVWVLHWALHHGRPVDELVRLEAATLRPAGRAAPIGRSFRAGPLAADVEVAGGVAWVTVGVDGTLVRFDSATNTSTTIRVGAGPIDSALLGGTVWVPDSWSGALTPVDARAMQPGATDLHPDYPFSVAASGHTLWVLAQEAYAGPGGPSRLYRIDGRSRAIVGRPVQVGSDVGWAVAGAGAVWVRSSQKRALLKYVATSPPPASAHPEPTGGTPPPAPAGPLRPGRWTTHNFAVPFTFSIAEPGWLAAGDHPEGIALARVNDPLAAVTAYAPRQAFTPQGRVQRLRTPRQAVALVRANPHLRVGAPRSTTLGGMPATEVAVRVKPHKPYPPFCQSPCVVLYPFPASSAGLESARAARMWFLSHRGRIVVVVAEADARRPRFTRAEALLRTMHFG